MTDIKKIALELLAAEYDLGGNWAVANALRHNGFGNNAADYEIALRAIVAAFEPQWNLIEFNEDGDPTNVPADTPILVPPTKRLGMTVAKWNPLDGWETETCSEWVGIYRPTHWQPLPAEPEVGS